VLVATAAVVGACALALQALPAASGAPADRSPQKLVGGRGDQYFGAQDGPYTGWSEGSLVESEHDRAIIRGGAKRVTIRPKKGGATLNDIYGGTAIYTNAQKKDSDIKFFDIAKRKTRNPPKGVNTRALEKRATRSGDLLLFSRIHFRRGYLDYRYAREQVILFNLKSHKRRLLADARTDRNRYALAGQLNGQWAVWYECTGRRCRVRRMSLASDKMASAKTKRPVAYAPSVTETGTVFFAASGYICGTRVQLYRWRLGGSPHLVYNEGKKIDTYSTYALTVGDGTERVIFDLTSCTKGGGDVYKIDFDAGSETAPPPSATPSPSSSDCSPLPICPSLSPPFDG
jgi:hypothetical protein